MEPVSLYATCLACDGHGRTAIRPGVARTEVCGRCRGRGRAATGDGAAIVELLRLTGLLDMAPEELNRKEDRNRRGRHERPGLHARRRLKHYEWVDEHAEWELEVIRRPEGARGWVILPIRWTVERTFAWLGRCRRLSKDREKTILSSESFVKSAMIRLMLHRLRPPDVDPAFRYRNAGKTHLWDSSG